MWMSLANSRLFDLPNEPEGGLPSRSEVKEALETISNLMTPNQIERGKLLTKEWQRK